MIQVCPDMHVYISKLNKINLWVQTCAYEIQIYNCISPLTLPVDTSTLIFRDTVSVKMIRAGFSSLRSRSNGLMLAVIPYDKCGGVSMEEALSLLEYAIKNKQRK